MNCPSNKKLVRRMCGNQGQKANKRNENRRKVIIKNLSRTVIFGDVMVKDVKSTSINQ